jgi:hypothetical protein
MAVSLFNQLPDELIKNVLSYWSPHNAKDFERIKKLMNTYQKGVKDPNYYLKMLMEHPEETKMRFRFTKSCFYYKDYRDTKERRINLKKDLYDYHNFISNGLKDDYNYILLDKLKVIEDGNPDFYHNTIIELYKADKDFWTYENFNIEYEEYDELDDEGDVILRRKVKHFWENKYKIFREFYLFLIFKRQLNTYLLGIPSDKKVIIDDESHIRNLYENTLYYGKYLGMGDYTGLGGRKNLP